MMTAIILSTFGFVLCAIAGLAKSHMDTIVFYGTRGFMRYPANLRVWLISSIPHAKWRDGWHVCQQVWHLTYALGFWCMAWAGCTLAGGRLWIYALSFAGAWLLRLCAHGIGFSLTYPIK